MGGEALPHIGRVHHDGLRVAGDRLHPHPVPLGLAVAAVFGILDRDQVVDEEDRPDVGPVVEPVEPRRLVEAQVRGVEVERVHRHAFRARRPQHREPGLELAPAALARIVRLARGRARGRDRQAEPPREVAIDRIVAGRDLLGPGRDRRVDEARHLAPVEHLRAERRRDEAETRAGLLQQVPGIGEVDPVDPGRARMAQAGDEAGEVEGDGMGAHGALSLKSWRRGGSRPHSYTAAGAKPIPSCAAAHKTGPGLWMVALATLSDDDLSHSSPLRRVAVTSVGRVD